MMRIPRERSSIEAYPPSLKHRLRVAIGGLANAIVANSPAGDEYWRDRVGDRVPRYIVPNALPLDDIAAAPQAPVDGVMARERESLIVFAGRFEESKGAEILVRALSRLPAAIRFRAVFFGDGPRRANLERVVTEHDLGSRATLMGYRSNLWSVMKDAAVLVSPSRFEGSPNVVLEAMACNCPLVVSNIRAHREILDDRSALLVDAGDVAALARAIEVTIRDAPASRRRAAEAASRVARHAIPLIGQQYLDIYREVLSRGREHRTALPRMVS